MSDPIHIEVVRFPSTLGAIARDLTRRRFRAAYRPDMPEAVKLALWGICAPLMADPEAFAPAPDTTESLSRLGESTGAIPQPPAHDPAPVALDARRGGPGDTPEEAS